MNRFGVWIMRALALLPLPVLRALGAILGRLLHLLAARRRRVGEINLRLCWPQASEAQRRQWLVAHFVAFAQAWLDRSWLWHSSRATIERRLRWVGDLQGLDESQPTVIFAPHFVGLDAGWTALTLRQTKPLATIYTPQRSAVVDAWMREGRQRFGEVCVCRREDGLQVIRSVLKRQGLLYLLPDLNHGVEESVFVPFFGRPAATVPSLSRLAKVGRARVVPLVTHLTPEGYEVRVGTPWIDFPSDDALADTARMNRELESLIAEHVSQYHWLHQRFKSSPDGGPTPYDAG